MKDSATENPIPRKKKLRAVLIAALLGGLLFAGLSLAMIKDINQSRAEGIGGAEGDYVIIIPLLLIIGGTKFKKWLLHQPSELLTSLAVIIVNGLVGAFLFAALVAFGQFIVKHEREN